MQPTSLSFIAFFLISLLIYYCMPGRWQRYWLAIVNLVYVSSFGSLSLIYLILLTLFITLFGVIIQRERHK